MKVRELTCAEAMVRRRYLVQAGYSLLRCPELEEFTAQVLLGLIFGIHAESSMEKHSLRVSWHRFVAPSIQFASCFQQLEQHAVDLVKCEKDAGFPGQNFGADWELMKATDLCVR